MNRQPDDIDKFLPYGEMLRGFVEQPFVSKGDLSNLLRQRGVFVNPNDKRETIPWITGTLLSSDEFDRLRESQKTKEDNPKINTQTIPWASENSLLEGVPDHFDINSVLDLEFSNFAVLGSPQFVPVDGDADHLVLEFEVERNDYSKTWASTTNVFKGSIELEKVQDRGDVKVVVTHTADETKYVANKASQGIVRHFKDKHFIDKDADLDQILFGRFDNASRVNYFLALTRDISSSVLSFDDVVDLEFSPDSTSTLPEGMGWMEEKIEDLRVNGHGLHETFFIVDSQYHAFVHLYHVDARYRFDYKGVTGKCVISAGFPEYGKGRDQQAEFEVNVKSIAFDSRPKKVSRKEVSTGILQEFNGAKLDAVAQHASGV